MPGWFKGMEEIIQEHLLLPDSGLLSQHKGSKCVQEKTDCCCCHLLFTQPDFIAQKSKLEEFITSQGHICNFYPKYHCKLNFIEQYWGAAKLCYHNTLNTSNIIEMEMNMLACLGDIPLLQIQRWIHSISSTILAVNSSILRYANRSARFISAYDLGLSGAEAAWVNKRYHGHRTLPPIMLTKVQNAQVNMPTPL